MKTINTYDNLRKTGVIDDSVKSYVTEGLIYNIERQVLTPVLSKKLYQEFMKQNINRNYLPEYKLLLDDYIQYAVAYRLKSELMVELTFNLKTSGVQQNALDKTSTISLKDVKELQANYIEKSQWYLAEMVSYIEANIDDYPQFRVVETPADIVTSVDKYKCPIFTKKTKHYCR